MTAGLDEPVETVCRLCNANCGLLVDRRGDGILRVRGNPHDPVSEGYTCAKGRGLAEFHRRPDRLDRPRIDGRDTTWDECFADLDRRFAAVVAEHGAGAIGRYGGTGEQNDYVAMSIRGQVFGRLGSPQAYSTISVDIAPMFKATELVTGFSWETAPVWDPEGPPELCLVLGHNPVVSHGYWNLFASNPVELIRRFTRRGGELWVLDPRRTETALLATTHLAVHPDSDVHILGWLVRELLVDGADQRELRDHIDPEDLERLRAAVAPLTVDVAAARAGVDARSLDALLAAIRRAGQIACVSGTGVTFGRHALLAEWLRWVLLIITGSVDRPGGMRMRTGALAPVDEWPAFDPAPPQGRDEPGPRSRPELRGMLGEYPSVSLVDEIEAGNLRALVVHGGNPLVALPDPERTARALSSLELLVIVDVLDGPLTELATHVLPAAGVLEHADVVVRDRALYAARVVAPAEQRLEGWRIMARLGRSLGVDVFDGRLDPETATDDDVLAELATFMTVDLATLRAAGAAGVERPRRYGWVRERLLAGGKWRVAPHALVERLGEVLDEDERGLRLVCRRTVRSVNSARYGSGLRARDGRPRVQVHPLDATTLGLQEGDVVEVVSAVGAVRTEVAIDPTTRPGVVSMTHGAAGANVARLVSASTGVDPLTGQPVMTGLRVDLRLVEQPIAATEGER